MYCNKCGKKIPENSQFCRHCGNKTSTHNNTPEIKENYFISHWKLLLYLLGPAFISALGQAIFIVIGIFILEVIASFFGYCITVQDAECSGTGLEMILLPLLFGGLSFVLGGFSILGRSLVVIAQSSELKYVFGLSNRSKSLVEYITAKGLNTLFMPRYLLMIFSALLLLFVVSDLTSLIIILGLILVATDLRFLRFVFIKLLKLDKTKLDNKK